MNPETLCFAYSPSEFAVFSIPTLSASEVSIPLPITASTVGMGAFTGLTGYMSLGLGAKAKPAVVQINDSDTLIVKDSKPAPKVLLCTYLTYPPQMKVFSLALMGNHQGPRLSNGPPLQKR